MLLLYFSRRATGANIAYRILPMSKRLAQMASHMSSTSGLRSTYTLYDLPKTNVFTSNLPADPDVPTPSKSHKLPRDHEDLFPRLVKDALYTFVRPENTQSPELLAVSPAAMKDLGIKEGEEKSDEFLQTLAGNRIITLEDDGPDANVPDDAIYPWAQCYGGYQFGQWAGQLGDGRAISLFETEKKTCKAPWPERYELQLKGAGRTPYSRFADGKAVLRSSLREFVVSEYLNAIGIPTTRALSLVLAPEAKVIRERIEPGAIVARFAETWIRIGTFDLLRARGNRNLLRKLADFVAEKLYGGWENLPAKIRSTEGENIEASKDTMAAKDQTNSTRTIPTTDSKVVDGAQALETKSGVSKDTIEGEGKFAENRYTRLYRQIVRRNARTVALWQAYGFMNGVLNTDNTSIYGLSMDYGPFAFMDVFDPNYTPNHDDHMLRYAYKNQPTIIWWNLVRLGEAFGELIGSGPIVDDETFVGTGVKQEDADELIERAETLIGSAGEEYKAVFMEVYKQSMTARFGLKTFKQSDFEELYSEWLDILEAYELDYNQSFRRLSSKFFSLQDLISEEKRREKAAIFFRQDQTVSDEARTRIAKWLDSWRVRIAEDWGDADDKVRWNAMNAANPNFVPKGWILDEVIERVEHQGDRDVLPNLMKMALDPYAESWSFEKGNLKKAQADAERFCGDVPKYKEKPQCSCSS
ncbi:uncharacterized protein PV09_09578 [Verruconis gallopava]|uniref:Selenoprotein O n=1 Tax=Verruconis gallopava TaxID=253628 RepID=A0A0D1YD45_9PEZI|nr:uncharacterized protein PV09_09578 [Verruconis gallopava]KIV98631.1 hypothetical protein PV09_09578 [Verruconis gallopava]